MSKKSWIPQAVDLGMSKDSNINIFSVLNLVATCLCIFLVYENKNTSELIISSDSNEQLEEVKARACKRAVLSVLKHKPDNQYLHSSLNEQLRKLDYGGLNFSDYSSFSSKMIGENICRFIGVSGDEGLEDLAINVSLEASPSYKLYFGAYDLKQIESGGQI